MDLIYLAIVFLVVALIAHVLGAKGVAGISIEIAKIIVWIFVILFALTLLYRLLM